MNKTYDISSVKRVTRTFHVIVMQNNGKEMYKKNSVLHVQSCIFADHFQTVKRMLAPDWAQKMRCIIVLDRRTASHEFFS